MRNNKYNKITITITAIITEKEAEGRRVEIEKNERTDYTKAHDMEPNS